MIKVYTYPAHASSKKAIKWLQDNELEYTELKITEDNLFSEDEIIAMLKMVDDVYDLISTHSKTYKKYASRIERMQIKKQLIPFLQKNLEIVNFPIMMNKHQISTGFKEKNVKKFLPKSKRIQLLYQLVKLSEQ